MDHCERSLTSRTSTGSRRSTINAESIVPVSRCVSVNPLLCNCRTTQATFSGRSLMISAVSWRGKPKPHVYPVVRIEIERLGLSGGELHGIDVPVVLSTEEEAEAEAARLNALNGSKGHRYLASLSRLYPEGRANRDR